VLLFVGIPLVSFIVTFLLLLIFSPVRNSHFTPVTPAAQTAGATMPIADPVQLDIGRIGVSAKVSPVGLASNGDMEISSNAKELAWYQPGPKPGEEGSAVIAGHYGWKDGVPSVFNNLNRLVAGDVISVYSKEGTVEKFSVQTIRQYAPSDDATAVFKSDDGKAHLNLITCQGTWSKSEQTYSERLVVFTNRIIE
jgi:LPXTG-site transpeptidase (sortase) family protein